MLPRAHYSAVLKIQNQSAVTSGVYERQLEAQGKHYHHILDPQTGYPAETDVISLTVVADDCRWGNLDDAFIRPTCRRVAALDARKPSTAS